VEKPQYGTDTRGKLYMSFSNKKELEIALEKLPRYRKPKRTLEQYETPPSIASHILWNAHVRGDLIGKAVLEPGCGTAKLSIGALMLGSKTAICIDVDAEILKFTKNMLEQVLSRLASRLIMICGDFRDVDVNHVDVVIMNPPFGVYWRNRGIDLQFLKKALSIANSVYTIHKYSNALEKLVQELAAAHKFMIVYRELLNFPIPMMFETHKRKVYRVKTVFYVLKRVE